MPDHEFVVELSVRHYIADLNGCTRRELRDDGRIYSFRSVLSAEIIEAGGSLVKSASLEELRRRAHDMADEMKVGFSDG